MKRVLAPLLALAALVLIASAAPAHFNMLLPDKASIKKGETATLVYQWGHPFEHQLFDAPAPQSVFVLSPDGKKTDLARTLEKITVPSGDKKVTAYRFRFTPEQRGDYVFILNTPPIWMEEDKEFLQDTVKVVLHVQVQKGWDAAAETFPELLPLTRPYGLQAGMVFQARAVTQAKAGPVPLPGSLVEVERYNPAPPKELPPDEHITRTVKTDPNGIVACTLTEPGWWSLTTQVEHGQKEHQGKDYPVRHRATLWVFVDEKVK